MGTSIHAVVEYAMGSGPFFCLGTANLLRDHRVFSAIAFGEGGLTEGMPYPPRGLPDDCSLEAVELFVDPEAPGRLREDLHTPGWLSLSELEAALQHQPIAVKELRVEYRAIMAAMRVLADAYGPEKVRIVFCFDG